MSPQETNSVGHLETGWAGHDCPVCGIGKVVPEKSAKETLTIYGRNGTRAVTSTNYRWRINFISVFLFVLCCACDQ